jgi:hypothetical protein
MTFIILFVVFGLSVGIYGEITKKGKDNIIFRVGEEVTNSGMYRSLATKAIPVVNKVSSVWSGLIVCAVLLVIGIFVFYAIKITLWILQIFFG